MAVTSLPPTVGLVDELLARIQDAASAPLGRAVTLPPQVYGSEEIYRLEVERVFRPGWFAAARADQVSKPGDYLSVDVVGEPLVITRDRDGDVHVLSRLCAHRWMEVAAGAGNAPALQCPYHLWTYSLSGQLVGAPHMTESADFDKASCRLATIRHEIWGGRAGPRSPAGDARGAAGAIRPQRPDGLRNHRLGRMRLGLEDHGRELHGVLPPHRFPSQDTAGPVAR
jgi:nitrite reductase/ring-hydroxylating ferredoxin subunit